MNNISETISPSFTKPKFRGFVTASVMLATTLYALDWTIVVIAFPHMKGIFSATEDQIAWVVTCYVVASAIAMPTAGWASRRFGRKAVMLFSVGGFTLSSVFCGLADSLFFEVVARTAQGFSGGFIVPLSAPIILDSYPQKEHSKALAIWSFGTFAGSFVGPVVGGYIIEYMNWRWIFYINIPIGILSFVGLFLFMKETKKEKHVQLDWFGFLTLAVGVSFLQIMADRGHRLDWFESVEIIIECIIAIVSLYLFVIHSLTAKKPFLDPRLLHVKQFLVGAVLLSFYGLLQTPVLVMMPVFLEDLIGYPVDLVGLLQMPRGIGLVISLTVAGRLSGKLDPRYIMGFGFALLAVSNFEMAHWSLNVNEWKIVWTGLFQGMGAGFIMLPTQEVAFHGSSTDQRTDASAIMNLSRSMCSSLGVSMTLVVYILSTSTSRSDLVPNITWQSISNPQNMLGDEMNISVAALESEIERQAAMLGYDGAFLFLTILSLLPIVILFFVGKLKVGDQKN